MLAPPMALHAKLADAARRFAAEQIDAKGGQDPVAAIYPERRAAFSLFSKNLSDDECEAVRPYLFGRKIPVAPGDPPVPCLNLIEGEWKRPAEMVPMRSLADRRIVLSEVG